MECLDARHFHPRLLNTRSLDAKHVEVSRLDARGLNTSSFDASYLDTRRFDASLLDFSGLLGMGRLDGKHWGAGHFKARLLDASCLDKRRKTFGCHSFGQEM